MNKRTSLGLLLVALGIALFSTKGGPVHPGTLFGYFWPSLFVLPLGVFFHWLYFGVTGRRGAGLLIPGGILLVSGAVCQFSMLFDLWAYLWPGFPLAVAVGMFEFYWMGGRNKWLLIPIHILLAVSLLFFAVFSLGALWNGLVGGGQFAIAIALVTAGVLMFATSGRDKKMEW